MPVRLPRKIETILRLREKVLRRKKEEIDADLDTFQNQYTPDEIEGDEELAKTIGSKIIANKTITGYIMNEIRIFQKIREGTLPPEIIYQRPTSILEGLRQGVTGQKGVSRPPYEECDTSGNSFDTEDTPCETEPTAPTS